MLLGNNIVM